MQVDVYINNVQKYDPNNLKGIVYPSTMSKDGPTQLNIDNGSYVFPNPYVEQTSNIELKYDPLGHIIPVTPDGNPIPNAPTPQYTNSPTNPSAVEPNEPVPNIPGYTPKVSIVTPTDPGTDTKVIYVPIEQGSITVTVHDVTDNVNLPQYGKSSGEQDVGTRFTYDKNTVITDLENKGYKVLNPDVVIPTTISKGAQNIVINVEHELVPVTPENPGTPGQPINPNNPDGPKWPDGTAKNNLEATGTQTIHYEGAGNKTPADNIQHFTFTKSATVDKVTGKVVSETGWNVSSHTFGNVDTPVVAGYHADKSVDGGATITPDDLNKTIVVTYAPNGHVIPVGPNGQPIPDAPQPQFPTNPDNPTGTTPSEVPVVPGYHPENGKPGDPVDPVPGKPGENVPVKYVPDTPTPETYTGSQTIKFVDGNGTELHTPDTQTVTNLTGDHTFGKINTPVIKGYTTTETTAGGATVTKENPNAVITVTYTPNGHIIPVGPDGKPIPDAPQPQFPTNPDNPSETTPGQVPDVPGYHPESGKPGEPVNPVPGKPGENVPVKYVPDTPTPETYTGSQTIKFVDGTTGKEIESPNVQTATNLTGDHTFGKINTPVIKGYTTTETTAGGATVTKNNPNATITVTYTPNGHIIPVGPDGKPIPDAPQPQFPTNPSETTPSQVPDVPGYHPENGKPGEPVNPVPGKPGENVPVKYVPNTPTPETYNGSQTIKFVDGTTGKEIESPNVQKATNLTGDHTFGKINTPVIKGYTTTETTAGGATVTKNNPNATITVTYTPNGHIIPVGPDGKPIPDAPQPQFPTNPDNPSETTPGQVPDVPGYHPESGKPGEPVNPVPGKPGENVPVKYVPNTPTPETYTGSQTIKFVDGTTGKEIESPNVQKATNLTGEHTFGKINTPVIKGYTTTETTAGGATVTKENPNAVITVTYTPNGHIIPVGPDGKPIPDAPQPQFPTNPDNPSETTPGQVPDVPGYHPESGKPGEPVNPVPGKPGENVPVKYVPNTPTPETYTGSQTIKFVDGNGTELHTPDTQTATNLTGDHTFGKINTPVIKGYTTTETTAGGATVTKNNPNATITVTYTPNGHIIPVGPDGKPIPDAPQPQFPTNPDNPSETTPGQVPDVPGYHPESGKPGEPVDPVPGKPGENVPVKYVPDTPTPETYTGSQTIKFVDGNGTELHTPDTQTVTNLTGDHTFGKINTPVIKGYTTTETTAGGATVTKENPNAVITVTYTPNGHIIPVGPDGKPIPDAPQPQFPTNPDNPSETTPGQVPDVPGYHPESGKPGEPVNSVPGKPGEDIPVRYVPDTPETYTGSQTIKFVDGKTGKEIESPNVQTATNLTGSHTFGKINTPVIKGYTTTQITAGGATVTRDNPNAVVTVTYIPNGHIIPVGPNGKPIPSADQPQFPTNPENPTETTPGQLPVVPGYHPEVGKPGENVNPVPGKPGEDVPVKYVPDTPVKPSTPFTPTTPETPRNNPTRPSETPIANNVESNKKKEELPQTGRKENQAQLIGLAVAGIIFLLGLIGDRKKKE
ncbi:LPXTG cell wall anchor domain-containing protein [Lactobacillus johnsonii]|uniref:mucin-binding protein n=1 Tax=Lactobacillus johnsonii TaxID=33959 RepID=UPI002415F619|nr:LPXTG cell wall anchor domain-containing protein [Lactobacillus johnsonii]MDG4988599.1 LPXTG cell wall anchor domain-containing protein [Lactobacillus johnsonii]